MFDNGIFIAHDDRPLLAVSKRFSKEIRNFSSHLHMAVRD